MLPSLRLIIVGSYLGIPLSTTHCQVGATVGVGLLEGKGGINPRTQLITLLGWVHFTCVSHCMIMHEGAKEQAGSEQEDEEGWTKAWLGIMSSAGLN